MTAQTLREAARIARSLVEKATDFPGERWIVDQSPDDGLIVGAYQPEDVDEETGGISNSCLAYFAYPGDEENRTYKNALPVAAHIAAWQPAAALAVAEVFERAAADFQDLPGSVRLALVQAAEEFLRGAR